MKKFIAFLKWYFGLRSEPVDNRTARQILDEQWQAGDIDTWDYLDCLSLSERAAILEALREDAGFSVN